MVRVIALLILLASPAWADATGPARVIDGDTIQIAGEHIRLHGIDAPEKNQFCWINGVSWECGLAASGELVQLTAGKRIICREKDVDRYGRTVAVCYVGLTDVNAAMVANGWAPAYRQYSTDYVGIEQKARAAQRGLWKGEFVPPWDWRRGERLSNADAISNQSSPAVCCKFCRKGKGCGDG